MRLPNVGEPFSQADHGNADVYAITGANPTIKGEYYVRCIYPNLRELGSFPTKAILNGIVYRPDYQFDLDIKSLLSD